MNKFDRFPTGQDRKNLLKNNKDSVKFMQDMGGKLKPYTWIDSHADNYSIEPGQRGEPFIKSFREIIPPQHDGIVSYVEQSLASKKDNAIGIEFGGPGSNFFGSFSPHFFKQSVGVTLLDHRRPTEINISKKKDREINHKIVLGDIFDQKTYESLDKILEDKKADFIMSRMAAGLENVPEEPYTVGEILKIWYKLLNENGLMLVQTPVRLNNLLEKWVKKIQEEYKGSLEIEYKTGIRDSNINCTAFSLRKLKNAPEDLPLLGPKTIFKTKRGLD